MSSWRPTPEQKRQWNRERNARERQVREALVWLHGGRCVQCKTVDGPFEFDHINPETKVKKITTLIQQYTADWDSLMRELRKCQLLCQPCHRQKTKAMWKPRQHGTLTMYNHSNCRCDECRTAYKTWRSTYLTRKKVS